MNYPLPLAILDTETTGFYPNTDRIIEIGIIRVENGTEVRRYNTLINPERTLPTAITRITGITDAMLVGTPTWDEISNNVSAMLEGALFVAHNAQFDLGFVRGEFARQGKEFETPALCSVKLSRALYPEHVRHDLETIIHRFGFDAGNRHRAEDDAHVLWQFLRHISASFPEDVLARALHKSTSR